MYVGHEPWPRTQALLGRQRRDCNFRFAPSASATSARQSTKVASLFLACGCGQVLQVQQGPDRVAQRRRLDEAFEIIEQRCVRFGQCSRAAAFTANLPRGKWRRIGAHRGLSVRAQWYYAPARHPAARASLAANNRLIAISGNPAVDVTEMERGKPVHPSSRISTLGARRTADRSHASAPVSNHVANA
jgi:hypothetical protein